jgi:hypothetical protein
MTGLFLLIYSVTIYRRIQYFVLQKVHQKFRYIENVICRQHVGSILGKYLPIGCSLPGKGIHWRHWANETTGLTGTYVDADKH